MSTDILHWLGLDIIYRTKVSKSDSNMAYNQTYFTAHQLDASIFIRATGYSQLLGPAYEILEYFILIYTSTLIFRTQIPEIEASDKKLSFREHSWSAAR